MTDAVSTRATATASPIKEAPEFALQWHREGKGGVLATVVQTWGSAPRPVGSMLAVSEQGQIEGSVSGGCVEGSVILEAQQSLVDGKSRRLEFGVSDEDAFAAGLSCGGTIRVQVDPVAAGDGISESLLAELVEARRGREGVILASAEVGGDRRLLRGDESGAAGEAARRAFRTDRSGFVEIDGSTWFLGVHNPPLRLVVIGGSHIAQALTAMARIAGYDVTLIDPREALATEERFPGIAVQHGWPDEVLPEFGLDSRVAVVTLTHDPKIDDLAICETLASDAFYLGCLGSKRTHEKRLSRLQGGKFEEEALARIHAPVGLDIGASSPAEIAIAILAEITKRLRTGRETDS